MSKAASCQSKCVDLLSAASSGDGPPANRPPQSEPSPVLPPSRCSVARMPPARHPRREASIRCSRRLRLRLPQLRLRLQLRPQRPPQLPPRRRPLRRPAYRLLPPTAECPAGRRGSSLRARPRSRTSGVSRDTAITDTRITGARSSTRTRGPGGRSTATAIGITGTLAAPIDHSGAGAGSATISRRDRRISKRILAFRVATLGATLEGKA